MIAADDLSKVVEKFPSPDDQGILSGADREAMLQAVAEMQSLGRDGVVALVNLLKGPAQGGDTRPHHLLHALAVSVSAQDSELRKTVAEALASTLQPDRPREVNAFVIRQLQVAGGVEVVPVLGQVLSDPELCEPATQALLAIGSAAAETLRNALSEVPDPCRLTVAQALGVLRDQPSVPALTDLLTSADEELRLAAVWGLARIGQPSSINSVLQAADDATGYERIKATQACLLLAENLAHADEKDDARRVYQHLQETRTDERERYVREAVSIGLAAIDGTSQDDAWRVLLDGSDLSAWQNARGGAPSDGWVLEDGAVVRKRQAGDLWTKDRFGDFVLDLEFKTTGNSGVFIRTDKPTDNVQTGIEIQIYTPSKQPGKHTCGAVYDCLAPSKIVDRPNEWNHLVITTKDQRIQVEMNGEQIIEMDLNEWSEPGKNPDGTDNKFRNALKDFKREGHIGLQDHGAEVAYRNMRIRPL